MRRRIHPSPVALLLVLVGSALTGCESTAPARAVAPASEVGNLDLSAKPPTRTPAETAPDRAPVADDHYSFFPGKDRSDTAVNQNSGITPAGKDYNVSFDSAPVANVVRGILGDVLKVAYTIDPRVTGSITLSTGGPVTSDELLKILETALQMVDAAMVYDKDHFSVVPSSAVSSSATAFDLAGRNQNTPPGYGVSALALRHVKASAVKDLLEGFISRSGLVRSAVDGNMLLLKGTAEERESLIAIARSFDVDAMRDQSAAIATLKNSSPGELIGQLNRLAMMDGQSASFGLIRFEPLDRLNAILIVASDRNQVREALTWISRLDQPSKEGSNYFIYKVQNTKATDLAKVLAQTFGESDSPPASDIAANNISQANTDQAVAPSPVDAMSPSLPDSRITRSDSITANLGGNVRIVANNATNSIIIRAPARVYRQILEIVRQIDQPPVQVYINVMIAEITLNDNLRYGVQAYLQKHNFSLFDAAELPLAPTLPGFNFVLGGANSPSIVLEALSQVTDVRVVSSPSIVTLDNQMATIKVGNQVPITTQQAISTQSAGAPLVNTIEYRDAGVILRVTPRVSETDLVSMDVTQELSAVVAPPDSTESNLTPVLSERSINSSIAVYNRQTVVLGGLIASQQNNDHRSVPLLNKVPLIGDLIGKTDNASTRTELVVFITPRVMRDAIDASRVSEEVRNALQLMGKDVAAH